MILVPCCNSVAGAGARWNVQRAACHADAFVVSRPILPVFGG